MMILIHPVSGKSTISDITKLQGHTWAHLSQREGENTICLSWFDTRRDTTNNKLLDTKELIVDFKRTMLRLPQSWSKDKWVRWSRPTNTWVFMCTWGWTGRTTLVCFLQESPVLIGFSQEDQLIWRQQASFTYSLSRYYSKCSLLSVGVAALPIKIRIKISIKIKLGTTALVSGLCLCLCL